MSASLNAPITDIISAVLLNSLPSSFRPKACPLVKIRMDLSSTIDACLTIVILSAILYKSSRSLFASISKVHGNPKLSSSIAIVTPSLFFTNVGFLSLLIVMLK